MSAPLHPSEFKARCGELVESIHRSGQLVVVVHHGDVMARLSPPRMESREPLLAWLRSKLIFIGDAESSELEAQRRPRQPGSLAHLVRRMGDVESPIDIEWDANA